MYNLYPVASRDASPIFKLILYLQFRHFDIEERVFICRNLVDMITNHSHIFPSPNLYEDACKEKILDIESVCKLCIDAFDLLEFEARERGTELQDTDALRSQLTQCVSAKDAEQVIDTLAGRCSLTQIQEMPKSKNIQLALEYINRNYASQLSLEQVAAQVYLNPDYFSRELKECASIISKLDGKMMSLNEAMKKIDGG